MQGCCPHAKQILKCPSACGEEEKKVGKILLQATEVYDFMIYFSYYLTANLKQYFNWHCFLPVINDNYCI